MKDMLNKQKQTNTTHKNAQDSHSGTQCAYESDGNLYTC